MTIESTDAVLVASHLAGDPSALGGIYDRYADSLHDTAAAMLNDRSDAADVLHDVILIAAERLAQLRDPDRLKPWLFAILRNEVYRRTKARRRTVATDFSGGDDGYDMADDRYGDQSDDVADDMAGDELAALVRGAARGLDERDQLVLELSVRQGLDGQDLADALGVSANQSYTLVHRMRERVERSLSAYVVARAGRRDCDDLDGLLGSWDGEFTVLIRKRVARHVDKCDVCDDRRRKVAPLALFAGAPAYAAPAALRDQILGAAAIQAAAPPHPYAFTATDGFPQIARAARRVAAWIAPTAAASLVLVVVGLSVVWTQQRDDDVLRDASAALESPDVITAAPTTEAAAPSTTLADGGSGLENGQRDPNATAPPTTELPTASTSAPVPVSTELDESDGPDPGKAPTTPAPTTDAPVVAPPPTAPPAPTNTAPPATAPPATSPPSTATPIPATTLPPATTAAPSPGEISLSSTLLDFGGGSGSSTRSLTITNVGDLSVDYAVSGVSGPFSVATPAGTLTPGGSVDVSATIVRSDLGEGSVSGSVTVTGGGTNFTVGLSASVGRPPVLANASVNGFCSASIEASASVSVSDESGVASASLSLSGPAGQSGSAAITQTPNGWFGFLSMPYSDPNNPGAASGSWSWTISATDTLGTSASTSGTTIFDC